MLGISHSVGLIYIALGFHGVLEQGLANIFTSRCSLRKNKILDLFRLRNNKRLSQ